MTRVPDKDGSSLTDAARRRASRRIAESIIPLSLLKGLADEGYDVGDGYPQGLGRHSAKGTKRKPIKALSPERKRITLLGNHSMSNQDGSAVDAGIAGDVCRLADVWYEARFEAALAKKVIHVVGSSLSDHDVSQLELLRTKSSQWNGMSIAVDVRNGSAAFSFLTHPFTQSQLGSRFQIRSTATRRLFSSFLPKRSHRVRKATSSE